MKRGAVDLRRVESDSEDEEAGPALPQALLSSAAKKTHSAAVPVAAASDGAGGDVSDEDDAGPAVPASLGGAAPSAEVGDIEVKASTRTLEYEQAYLSSLPSNELYEKSFMHRDHLSFVVVTAIDYVVTASNDGHVKFWKKMPVGIEFVKNFKAHVGRVVGLSASANGELLASVGEDRTLKIFDVMNFDMINMVKLPFLPSTCCMIHRTGMAKGTVAIGDGTSGSVFIYNAFDPSGKNEPIKELKLHSVPVHSMVFNAAHDSVISCDDKGMIEYWSADAYERLKAGEHGVKFALRTETDLFDFVKCRTTPFSLTLNKAGTMFAAIGRDRLVRVFRYATGKLYRKYDESLKVCQFLYKRGGPMYKIDDVEFGKRYATENELRTCADVVHMNAVFDESGFLLLVPTMFGVKVLNLYTNKVLRILGKHESTERFLFLGLFQGRPRTSMMTGRVIAAKEDDPTLFCTAFHRNRFFLFTHREPDADATDGVGRDVFNEKPTREELALAVSERTSNPVVTVHTTLGDFQLELFVDDCPKTCENFMTHAKNGYYNDCIFHRVIKEFMIQTGDPTGTGTGGESIWGGEFDDEIVPRLKHDKAGMLSMANRGPGTNGSQFFVTTAPAPWLDRKHTIFGQLKRGLDVVQTIENVEVDSKDRPRAVVRILSMSVANSLSSIGSNNSNSKKP